jgi:hypothetical protein
LIYTAKTIRRKGSSGSDLNDAVEDLLLSRRRRNRKVFFSLDLPDLSNNARPLIEQGHDLLIGPVYALSARRKSSFGV